MMAIITTMTLSCAVPFAVIDTHTHLTNTTLFSYQNNWVTKSYSLTNYSADTSSTALPCSKVVFMEAAVDPKFNVAEAKWVQNLADMGSIPQIAGICAFVPLEKGKAIEPVIRELKTEVPLLKGVRRILDVTDGDPCWFMKTNFTEGLDILAKENLHFELLTREPTQFECALQLVRLAPPNLTIVAQHLGNPNMSDPSQKAAWTNYVENLAALQNTVAKVSGGPERSDSAGFDSWTENQIKPYVKTILHAFGSKRTVFGGNWFVVERFSTYKRWAAVLVDILKDYPEAERKMIFHDNAQKYYRLS